MRGRDANGPSVARQRRSSPVRAGDRGSWEVRRRDLHRLRVFPTRDANDSRSRDEFGAPRDAVPADGDDKLTGKDARFGQLRVLVTNADGSTTAQPLAELGITKIDLRPVMTRIEMADFLEKGNSVWSLVPEMDVGWN